MKAWNLNRKLLRVSLYHSSFLPIRGDALKGGLGSQERVLAVLLEQALRIREEVASSLQTTRGSVLAEALSHRLLENHINTITHIVKQLSMDIQVYLSGKVEHVKGSTCVWVGVRVVGV